MYLFKTKKINLLLFLILITISCSRPCHRPIAIPNQWFSVLSCEMTLENPSCFKWWENLNDPLLSCLIEQGCREDAAQIAKSYIQLRAAQEQLKLIQKDIAGQKETTALAEELSNTGFIDTIKEEQSERQLTAILTQKADLDLSIDQSIYCISTLLNTPPGTYYSMLIETKGLPSFPCYIPIGTPCELAQRRKDVRLARKDCCTYQKLLLKALRDVENALSAVYYGLIKQESLEKALQESAESYKLTRDLYRQGFKDYLDVQAAFLILSSDEEAQIRNKAQLLQSYVELYQALGD